MWALERSNVYNGKYHILGGVLSAIDGINPDQLNIDSLEKRLESNIFTEVIIAITATLDGKTTDHDLAERLDKLAIKITRRDQGIPVGGEVDCHNDEHIAQTLTARTIFYYNTRIAVLH